ncbi:glycoside hydrolase family 28 protein [Pseudoduganella lutea]|uniref:Glycoside hydrolase family 28 protein n=1 Tax=Pseudoduganella lutea TaxID=321985 RepID=A0A4P6KSQ6_9BURK|nr:glycoside hydrolase family 28 protein [Pseudoduganella lutea]QBE62159.1 glycoside hydrolase family 28 protein [Pseudoduganella lutea]
MTNPDNIQQYSPQHSLQHSPQRRRLLRATSALLATGALPLAAAIPVKPQFSADPWQRAQQIADRCSRPLAFRTEDFLITAFGAASCALVPAKLVWRTEITDVKTPAPGSPDCYPAIAAAIAAASRAGGGRVLIPAGSWYCKGPIVLRSNVHVHLAANAQIYFSADPADYAKYGDIDCGKAGKLVRSRWQGNDLLNYCPLVYAYRQTNIALTGEDGTSVLNGQAGVHVDAGDGPWWDWIDRKEGKVNAGSVNPLNLPLETVAPGLTAGQRALIQGTHPRWNGDTRYLPALSEAAVPVPQRVFGIGHYLRPCMIELIGCSDVLLEGYHVVASPFWLHHPVDCRNVRFARVNMESTGPNNDGFDPESCDTVLVEHCTFNTGDDCIAIKSGKNLDTHLGPTRNVVIQDCVMNSGHGGVTLGSEMAAGIEHVYAQRIEFRNAYWATDPLRSAIRLKTNMNRGGFLRHLYVRDVTVPNGVDARARKAAPPDATNAFKGLATGSGAIVTIDCNYAAGDDGVRTRPPQVSDIHISRLRAGNAKMADGAFSCWQAVLILGPVASSFNGPAGTAIVPVTNVTITDCDFGTPRNGKEPVYLHNAQNVALTNVTIGGQVVNRKLSG